MEPIAAARALVDERFPECLAAFVGGSVITGGGTSTSDLDMVIITTREEAPYRESLRYGGWPVELFVNTTESYKWYFASDAKGRMPALARMCLDGAILRDRDGIAGIVREDARRLIEAGPEPLSQAQLDSKRYMLTDLLEDFIGSTRPEETLFIAAGLIDSAIDLLLAVNRKCSGKNKWAVRALDAAGGRLFEGFRQAGRRSGA